MKQQDALNLIEECQQELERPKGTVLAALNKLYRISSLLGEDELKVWCLIHQGDPSLNKLIQQYVENLLDHQDNGDSPNFDFDKNLDDRNKLLDRLEKMGVSKSHINNVDELSLLANLKFPKGVDFVEQVKSRLMVSKRRSDGMYHIVNVDEYLSYIKSKLQVYAAELHERLKYSGTVSSCFDVLKNSVDDKLLDLNPELAEQLMTIFKSVNTNDPEQWSHALTSCRRLLEGLADELFPATKEPVKGRELKQTQYINRLWAFMDKSIESESNRDLAKAHVDYLGGWLQRGYKVANKGVHAEIGQLEATKLVFHIYLVLADILEYLDHDISTQKALDLHSASMDEMEALAGISRDIAKEIVKLRVSDSPLTDVKLLTIKGLGQKTLDKLKEYFIL